MRQRCIAAVEQAIGRPITMAEATGIEQRLTKNMRWMAGKDPVAFSRMSAAQRLQQSAALAAKQLVDEAQLKLKRAQLSITAHDRIETFIADQKKLGMDGIDALKRTLVFVSDMKSNTTSVESNANAIRADNLGRLKDAFEAVDPRFFGLLESNEGIRLLTKEIFGEHTGNAEAAKGAKAWHEVADGMREHFNDAGGKIGELENWNVPQHHAQDRIIKAGRDAWVNATFPLLNRAKYLRDDGTPMTDGDVLALLQNAWETLATGGLNKIEPGVNGNTMLANANAESRSIHFKDADSYLEYQKQFGDKSLWGVMTGHVDRLAKQIALLETYGPNPDHTFNLILQKQTLAEVRTRPGDTTKIENDANYLRNLFQFVGGATEPVANRRMAEFFDTLRNWLTSSRLGSAAVTAIADEATIHLSAQVNKLPEMELIRNELAMLNPANEADRNLAHRAGLAVDVMTSHLNRWGQDTLGPSWSSKMATTVMRMSGLEALDGARRAAFGTTMMSALGEVAGKYGRLKDVNADDYKVLLSKGITEEHFAVWKLAKLEKWGAGNGVLTPEAIRAVSDADIIGAGITILDAAKIRREAAIKLLAVTLEETDIAVIRPGATDRFLTAGRWQRGTLSGELVRSIFLFKSFPLAMIARHWMRGSGMPTVGGRAMYLGSLVAGTTVLGALAQTIDDLLKGKDPRNYNPFEGEHAGKNWMSAFLKGGSLGLYGDFLFSKATHASNNSVMGSMLGPVAGLVEESLNLTQGNLIQLAQGKETKFGAEAVRFIKNNTPGASLWYAKAALDHIIFNQMQEYFSPGYLASVERRAKQEFGQTYFWRPGTGLDGMRAPDFAKAIGE